MKVCLNKAFPELCDRYYIDDSGVLYTNYGQTILKDCLNKKGYVKNGLVRTDGALKGYFRHRLVLQSFQPIDNYEGMQVNHIDGIKTNNHLDNLEWCTNQENRIHACRNGLAARLIGEANPYHRLTEEQVLEMITDLQNHIPYSELIKKYKCSKATISSIKNKRNWAYLTKDIIFL